MNNTYSQYKLTIGNRSEVLDEMTTSRWDEIYRQATERGIPVVLERRLVVKNADSLWLDGLRDEFGKLPTGSMLLQDDYVSYWVVIADNKERSGVLIGDIA